MYGRFLSSVFSHNTHSSGEQFVRFVNHLMNDMTYLLDEALRYLGYIRDYELLQRNQDQWNSLPQV